MKSNIGMTADSHLYCRVKNTDLNIGVTMFLRIVASLITIASAVAFANTANAVTFEVIHHFQGGNDGLYPIDQTLSAGADGGIYGIANLFVKAGQTYSRVIWRVKGDAYEEVERFLYGDFERGFRPAGKMVIDAAGRVYGVTTQGGPQSNGMTFVHEPGKPRRYFQHYIQSPENGLVRDESTGIFYGGGLRVIYQIDPEFTAVTEIALVPRDGSPAPFSVEPGKLHGSFYEDSPFMFTMDLNRGELKTLRPKHGISHTGTTSDGVGNYWGVAGGTGRSLTTTDAGISTGWTREVTTESCTVSIVTPAHLHWVSWWRAMESYTV